MKKNIYLVIFSTLISVILLYFVFLFNTNLYLKSNTIYKFNSIKHLNFHKKYSSKLHHLRIGTVWNEKNAKPNDFLFTTLVNFSNKKKNILFQGDSWAGQLTNKEREKYYLAKDYVIDFSLRKNLGFINAGINSYSPTLMKLQLEVLNKDFQINPDIIIAYIDQTDIGDENCRYKNNRILKNGKVIAVKEESFSGNPFDYSKIYGESEIILNKKNNLLKVITLANYRFYYSYKKLTNKFSTKLQKQDKKISKCYWPDIQRYLADSSEKELNYFKKSIISYVNYALSNDDLKKLILVTFPHKNHLNYIENQTIYKNNVSDIVGEINFSSNKVFHLNFTELIKNKKILIDNKTYYQNDPASHLADEFYSDVFIKKIMNNILD